MFSGVSNIARTTPTGPCTNGCCKLQLALLAQLKMSLHENALPLTDAYIISSAQQRKVLKPGQCKRAAIAFPSASILLGEKLE